MPKHKYLEIATYIQDFIALMVTTIGVLFLFHFLKHFFTQSHHDIFPWISGPETFGNSEFLAGQVVFLQLGASERQVAVGVSEIEVCVYLYQGAIKVLSSLGELPVEHQATAFVNETFSSSGDNFEAW